MDRVEYFVVARNNPDPSLPKELIERFWSSDRRTPEETFEKASKRQSWLKFREGWQDTRMYAARQMKLVGSKEEGYSFALPDEWGG